MARYFHLQSIRGFDIYFFPVAINIDSLREFQTYWMVIENLFANSLGRYQSNSTTSSENITTKWVYNFNKFTE